MANDRTTTRRGRVRLGLAIGGWTLFVLGAGAVILFVPVFFLIALGAIDLRAAAEGLVRPDVEAVGFSLDLDEPEYGEFTLRNTGETAARGVSVRVREDYTAFGAGTLEREVWLGDLAPGEAVAVPYHLVHPYRDDAEVGRLFLWVRSDRGTAFDFTEWSYAY